MKRVLAAILVTLGLALAALPPVAAQEPAGRYAPVAEAARALPQLRALIIAQNGEVEVREGYSGYRPDRITNIKSLSKTLLSALIGIGIERGVLGSVDRPISAYLTDQFPEEPDPRLARVTLGHLLSMRAGLESTSGQNYGAWIASANLIRFALARDFAGEPGAQYIYSTGNTHLLSAILTGASGMSTFEAARDWLARPLGMRIPRWEQDRQGFYMGGNNMGVSADDLLKFGEMYRNGGVVDGQQVVPKAWIDASWTPRGPARYFRHSYGYGWFSTRLGGTDVHYGWGYGGQMLYVAPEFGLTVVIISGTDERSVDSGYIGRLHDLMGEIVRLAREGETPPAAPSPS